MTKTATIDLINRGQATPGQLTRFEIITNTREDRVMSAAMDNGYLKMCWKTQAGYYISAVFDQYGETKQKEVFTDWNENENQPCNLLIIK
jgi:hypothetical protein